MVNLASDLKVPSNVVLIPYSYINLSIFSQTEMIKLLMLGLTKTPAGNGLNAILGKARCK